MLVWRLGRNVVGKYDAKDISGKGAFLSGGRWNSKGYHGVYASLHPAAAVLEAMVRLGRMNINPIDRCKTYKISTHFFVELVFATHFGFFFYKFNKKTTTFLLL